MPKYVIIYQVNKGENKEFDSCKRMSDTHKEFAIKVFDLKNREFENAYIEYLRTKSR